MMFATMLLYVSLVVAQPYCPPVVQGIHEEVVVPGVIQTESKVWVTMPDGRKITISVINGWLPEITENRMPDGSIHRKLDYSSKTPYTGDDVTYKKPAAKVEKKVEVPSRTKVEAPAKVKQAPAIPKPSAPIPKRGEGVEETPVKALQVTVTPNMRKLSEITDEPSITVSPRYEKD